MPEAPDHGTRSRYQLLHCRCLLCKASNAVYMRHLRVLHAKGIAPLGATISAAEAWARIRHLKAEQLTKGEIARRLGLKRPILEWHPERIRMRTALRLHRLLRELMLEGGALPLNSLNIPDDATRR